MANRGPNAGPKFEPVTDPKAIEAIRALPVWDGTHPRDGSPLFKALRNGDTVWIPGLTAPKANNLGAPSRLRKAFGFRTHVRPGERNGVAGVFMWADKSSAPAKAV